MSGGMECGKGRRTRVLTGPILTTITTQQGWAYHEGYWGHEDHGDHHDWGHR